MKRWHFIGVEVHCKFSEVAPVNAVGKKVHRGRCATRIPALVEELEMVPRPRFVVIEEGPLADWLWRNLRPRVEQMVICEPRRRCWSNFDHPLGHIADPLGHIADPLGHIADPLGHMPTLCARGK